MSDRKYRHRGYMDDDREEPRPRRPAGERPGRVEGAPRGRTAGMPTQVVFRCERCGRKIELLGELEADAACPGCGAPLHTCTNCASFDTSARFECRKPIPARIESKTRANTCEHFTPKKIRDLSARGPASPDDARAAFDALFRKKPG